MKKFIGLVVMVLFITAIVSASAVEKIGEVKTNGLMFKDSLVVSAFDDPDIKGVTVYITYYARSLSLNDSGRNSIAVVKTGKIEGRISSSIDIYKESRGWAFKEVKLARFYDKKRGVLIYLTYLDSISDKSSYHQIAAIPVN